MDERCISQTLYRSFIQQFIAHIMIVKKADHLTFPSSNFRNIVKPVTSHNQKQGDVIVLLKPLMKILANHKKIESTDTPMTANSIKDYFENDQKAVTRTEIDRGVLRIFLDRKMFLCSSLSSRSSKCMKTEILSKYRIHLKVKGCEGPKTITDYRCHLVANHLKELFILNGAVVRLEPLSENNMMPQKCSDLFPNELNVHNETYTVSSKQDVEAHSTLIFCSPVIDKTQKTKLRSSREDYIKLLKKEIEKACLNKHEDVGEVDWHGYVNNLAEGCLTLQLMAINHLSPIKLNTDEDSNNSKGSAFILYNYVRLCALFNKLDLLVEDKSVPPLPSEESVDYSHLTHEEEWTLFWVFIERYPEMIQDIAEALSATDEKTKRRKLLTFPTHIVTKFLFDLAHCLSVYYNRVHILPPSSTTLPPHMIPILWARIHLLKRVQSLMKSCFTLLGICPPTVM